MLINLANLLWRTLVCIVVLMIFWSVFSVRVLDDGEAAVDKLVQPSTRSAQSLEEFRTANNLPN